MLNALQKSNPPTAAFEIEAEQKQFDAAVARLEAEIAGQTPKAAAGAAKRAASNPGSRDAAARRAPATRSDAAPEQPTSAPSAKISSDRESPKMSRLDEMNKVLRRMPSDFPGVEAAALISEDGLMIASALTPELDETRVAGMTATLLNLGTRAAVELGRGDVKEVIIRGANGYAVMIDAGRGVMLLVLANETAKLGLIFFDMHEAIKSLKKTL